MPPVIDKTKCTGCRTCAAICPLDVFGRQSAGVRVPEIRYPDECWHCNACVLDCPAQAIRLRFPVPTMLLYTDAPAISDG